MSRHGGIHTDRQSGLYCTRRSYFAPINIPTNIGVGVMVEAPGYCPPGPKCLFHLTVYRHSRRTGTAYLGILRVNLKFTTVMAFCINRFHGERKVMKRLAFVTFATAVLALAGCNSNQDAVQNAELNQPNAELNDIANQAALDAEAANLAAQQNLLNAENAAAQDNTVNPREADEQNVSGM
jgi:hypothetical protein